MATMPNVVGTNAYMAVTTLIQAGIVPDNGQLPGNYTSVGYFDVWPVTINWVKSTSPPGVVTAQSPASGTPNVAFNASVNLTVSNYPVSVASLFNAGGYS